ncbi:MAG: hypothetical protein ABEJ87_03755 [Candidatus Nanohalobium sp.]
MGEEDNHWIIEIYNDETANVSIMSEEEAKAVKDMNEDFEDWQKAPVSEADEEEMIERAEDHGYEHDPW